MAERGSRAVPYLTSPALAQALPARPPAAASVDASRGQHLAHYLLFGAVLIAFLVSAGALVAPQITPLFHRPAARTTPANVSAPLNGADLETVLSYVQRMRADDTLVQVRPGVFAKRSNVEGVQVGGRTVFYDIMPHQSYGPLRAGRVSEPEVNVLARERAGDTLVLVYALK